MNDTEDLQALRKRAAALGLNVHHKAGAEKIKAQLYEHMVARNIEADVKVANPIMPDQPADDGPDYTEPTDHETPFLNPLEVKGIKVQSEADYRAAKFREDKRLAGSLIRCIVQCMDPAKKDWPGEYHSVGSAKLGTFKKYIPYNTGQPWHIPKIIYDAMLEKTCSVFYNAKTGPRGNKTRKSRQIKAFNIVVLPPLTTLEIKELARQQALAEGTGE